MIYRSLLLLMVFSVCVFAVDAYAQERSPDDLFQPPEEQQEPSDLEKLLGEKPEVPVLQKDPTTIKEYADQYYQNCLAEGHPKLDDGEVEILCSCTAAKLPERMTIKQAYSMNRRTAEGKLQRARFLEFVYIPCLRFPTAKLVEDDCMDNKEITKKYRNERAICACLGSQMADYMDEQASRYANSSPYRDRGNLDPLIYLIDSMQFNNIKQIKTRYCVDRFEYGKK